MSYQQLQAQLFANYAALRACPPGPEQLRLLAENKRLSETLRQFDASFQRDTRGGGMYRAH